MYKQEVEVKNRVWKILGTLENSLFKEIYTITLLTNTPDPKNLSVTPYHSVPFVGTVIS